VKDIVDAIKVGGAPSIGGKEVTQAPAGAPQTIMIVGSDKRFKEFGPHHSDTIMLVRLNSHAKATAMMSIPRDLKVEIPDHGLDKINAAYALGGAAETAKVVKELLSTPEQPFHINHIIDINFNLFQRLVNRLGRVYVDVDRDYYHVSTGDYSSIDIQPGYQLLSGSNALAYVRYRHTDTDIVRAARQQSFLTDAKEQYGTGKLFSNRKVLAAIFGHYTRSDHGLKTETGLIKLLNLLIALAGKPTVRVTFPYILGAADDPFVNYDAAKLPDAVARFMDVAGATAGEEAAAKAKKRTSRQRHHRKTSVLDVAGMVNAKSSGEEQGLDLGAGVGIPVYYPKLIPSQARYMGPVAKVYPRKYTLQGPLHHHYHAYRITLDSGRGFGNYIGVQATNWKNPPILKSPDAFRTVDHRKLELFYDGHRIQTVAWRTHHGVYWISNTLQELVPGQQMLAIAASLTRIGS
jgi:LCP family protein required for cell wall assembly